MDMLELKKGKMQVAKINYLAVLFIMLLRSCQASRNDYKLTILKRNRDDNSAIVFANIKDSDNDKLLVSAVKVNGESVYESDSLGQIVFNIDSGTYLFTGLSIHFEPVNTEEIKINDGDSVIVNFFLKPDQQPLYGK